MKDTAWWKQRQWPWPPGARRVEYWRPKNAIQTSPLPTIRLHHRSKVECVLLALATPSGGRSSLPPVIRTMPQAELLHDALIRQVGRSEPVYCPELTGRDEAGVPLRESHRHAHLVPLDLDHDRRIDHFLIWAPMGLGGEAQAAIRRLKRTWTKGGAGDLQLALAGMGNLASLRQLGAPENRGVEEVLGPVAGARTWKSLTPFVPARFLKKKGRDSLHGQVNAELQARGLPTAVRVEILPLSEEPAPFRHFVRRRTRGGNPPPIDVCYCLRLELAAPITGPLMLGYGSHFGLGLFMAATD
jgi:CRISPR-associated protein Csb2